VSKYENYSNFKTTQVNYAETAKRRLSTELVFGYAATFGHTCTM